VHRTVPGRRLASRGTALNAAHQSATPVTLEELARVLSHLAGPSPIAAGRTHNLNKVPDCVNCSTRRSEPKRQLALNRHHDAP
jgi:hypothetical protein